MVNMINAYNETRPLDKAIIEVCKDRYFKNYLEIGTREGDSLITVINNTDLDGIVCIDTWGNQYGGTDNGNGEHIASLVEQIKPSAKIKIMTGNSKEVLKTLRPVSTFDLILVDGDHSYWGCDQDMRLSWPLLVEGGIMLVDDLLHPAHDLMICFNNFCRSVDEAVPIKTGDVGVIRKDKPKVW